MSPLANKIFNEKLNEAVVQETHRWFLAAQRRGTHSAKTRTEVSGGGIKPWKQKGTGRARAGSIRSPLWRKGGVIFPPKPRDYYFALPLKVRKLALRVALSELNREERLKVVAGFSLPQPKTKEGVKFLQTQGVKGRVLIVLATAQPEFTKGVRNIAGVEVTLAKDLNIHSLLKAEYLLLDNPAITQLEQRIS